ncbi:MAG TPA: hypothetical protein VF990_01925 [Candidatus Dormibacteraeota bacterium]
MRRAAPLLVFLVVSCGTGPLSGSHPSPTASQTATAGASPSPTIAATPTASPKPVALPLGVVVKDFIDGGPNYTVNLVGLDGRVAATATGRKRSKPAGFLVQMSNISVSSTRLYYLDGDSSVMFLRPDGTSGAATTIAVDSNSAAAFAVSPDDSRIAIAVITYPYPAKTRIYVEDLAGGGHHVDLFSSGTVLEWPVGWHQGHLVIAVGINAPPQQSFDGFWYAFSGYHIADASTGTRLATICDGYGASVPPVPAGAVCANYPKFEVSDWSGATRPAPADEGCNGGALSPDGSMIADCQGSPAVVTLVVLDGTQIATQFSGTPVGWIDNTHLVLSASNSDLSIVDARAFTRTPIQAQGFFAGTIPGGL